MSRRPLLAGLDLLVLAALVVSGIAPYDRATWVLEVAPAVIAAPLARTAENYTSTPFA